MFNMNGTKNSDHQLPQKSLQIQQDDKFFSRLLSKESSTAHPSSRVPYYGGRPGSVPFLWESEPGTPKSKSQGDESLLVRPPLTPPPSYYYYNSHKKSIQRRSRTSNLLNNIFPKKINNICLKKTSCNNTSTTSTSPHSLWSSENSTMLVSLNGSSSTPRAGFRGGSTASAGQFSSSSSSSFDWRGDHEEEDQEVTSPNSTLCFGCYRL